MKYNYNYLAMNLIVIFLLYMNFVMLVTTNSCGYNVDGEYKMQMWWGVLFELWMTRPWRCFLTKELIISSYIPLYPVIFSYNIFSYI